MLNASSKKAPYGPISAIFVTIFAYIASYALFFMSIGMILWLVAQAQGKSLEALATEFDASMVGKFVTSVLIYGFMALVIYVFLRRVKASRAFVGIGRKPGANDVAMAGAIFIAYYIVLIITIGLVSQYVPSININQEQQLNYDTATAGLALIPVFIGLAIIPPIVEEFVMRGFLYSGLRKRLSIIPTALIVSGLFAVAHLQLGSGAPPLYVAAIDTFILSLFLVYLRAKTGAIWAGIAVHAIKNSLAFVFLFLVK
jgi:membrane protease YdiL (CAAX protease family)